MIPAKYYTIEKQIVFMTEWGEQSPIINPYAKKLKHLKNNYGNLYSHSKKEFEE